MFFHFQSWKQKLAIWDRVSLHFMILELAPVKGRGWIWLSNLILLSKLTSGLNLYCMAHSRGTLPSPLHTPPAFPTPCFAWALSAGILAVLSPLLDSSKTCPVPVCVHLCLSWLCWVGCGIFLQHWSMLWPASLCLVCNTKCIKYKVACILCFHSINGSDPSCLSQLLHVYTPSHTLCFSSDSLHTQDSTIQTRNTWLYFGSYTWNSLPLDLRHCSTLMC